MGAGEGKQLTIGKATPSAVVKTRGWNIFDKKKKKSIWQSRSSF